MPAIKTTILLDQFSIPVSITKAAVDTDVPLHEYHIEDGSRTCRKTLCAGCGKELSAEDIARGCDAGGIGPVLLTKEELRQIKGSQDNAIRVLFSTAPGLIPPAYFGASYFAVPATGGESLFESLRAALEDTGTALVGKALFGGLDTPVAINPAQEGLVITKLYFEEEISRPEKPYIKPAVSPWETEPVKKLIDDMLAPFDLSPCENEYQTNLRRLIAQKITGREDGAGL